MANTIWFRGDGGARIGFGHLARLAALAVEARARGWVCHFAVNEDAAALAFVADRGLGSVAAVPPAPEEEIDLLVDGVPPAPLVTDVRGKDPSFYEYLRDAGLFVAAIDDMGETLPTQLVISGSADPAFTRYREVRPPQRFLCGTAYIPLPPAYAPEPPPADDSGRTRLLVTYGGADADDYTRRALAAIADTKPMEIDVALGPAYTHAPEVRAWAAGSAHKVTVHAPAADMLPLYHRARLALAAGGITQYELLARGVPTISVPHVAREKAECDAFAAAGAVLTFGADELKKGGRVAAEAEALWEDGAARAAMAAAGRRLVDGRGAARIMDAITEMTR